MEFTTYNVIIAGEAKCGKTAFLTRNLTSKFRSRYTPTLGMEVYPLNYQSNHGEVRFLMRDCSGSYPGLSEMRYSGADAALVFFDVGNPKSFEQVPRWISEIRQVCGLSFPIVIVGNKVDLRGKNRKISVDQIVDLIDTFGYQYCDLSVKSNYNHGKPLVILGQILSGHDDLEFTASS